MRAVGRMALRHIRDLVTRLYWATSIQQQIEINAWICRSILGRAQQGCDGDGI